MSKFRFLIVLSIVTGVSLFAQTTDSLQKAASENKTLFVFFYKDLSLKTRNLQEVFDQLLTKLGTEVQSTKSGLMIRNEKEIVNKYYLNSSPMPLVLVFAPNGAITGGFATFAEEQLFGSIASPGSAQCLKALQIKNWFFFACRIAKPCIMKGL